MNGPKGDRLIAWLCGGAILLLAVTVGDDLAALWGLDWWPGRL